jgi:lysophospholipase L1-like esterase
MKSKLRILFQGDSITDAFRKPKELNRAFQLGNGYVFLIGANLSLRFAANPIELINRGNSGERVQELLLRWQEDAVDLKPDVLSLLAGVNFAISRRLIGREETIETFVQCYRRLLDPLREQNPDMRFILMEPFVLEAGEVTRAWREDLAEPRAVIAELSEEYGAIHLPLQQIFDEATQLAPPSYWAHDGIHATEAGFQLIANSWLEAVDNAGLLASMDAVVSDECHPIFA